MKITAWRALTWLAWAALAIYVGGRLYFFLGSRSSALPLPLAGLAYFGVLIVSIWHGGRAGLALTFILVAFHLWIFSASNDQSAQSPELRLVYNATLAMIAIVPGYLADLNRQLESAIQVKDKAEAELKSKNQELEWLARRDPLTELLNRRAFYDYAEKIFALSRRHNHIFGVILLDLDLFKRINDNHGHAAGDQALKQVSACIRSITRKEDLVARFGGEEFVVLLPETALAGTETLAGKLKSAVAALSFEFASGKTSITASFGATALRPEDQDLDAVIARADGAMYKGKELGRDQITTV